MNHTINTNKESIPPHNTNFIYRKISQLKAKLQLTSPGTYENLHKETRETFTTNHLIKGARFDLTKGFSENFQLSHSFSLSKQSQYQFISLFANKKWFIQGNVDGEGSLSSRIIYEHSSNLKSKAQLQFNNMSEPAMVQLESDFVGVDNSLNLKLVNCDPLEQTGVACVSLLQAVTNSLSLGVEAVFQRPNKMIEESVIGYALKYNFANKGIFCMQYQPGILQSCSYFRKVSENTSLATELQYVSMNMKNDINVTFGAKFDFRMSTLRFMADTNGKVSSVLENKIAPPISFLISGELDHKSGQSKFGVGLMFAT